MKRTLSLIIAMILCVQLVSVSAFAVGAQDATTAEIELELASAEEILGGPCKLESQETKVVGNYIVENRFYVLDTSNARASSEKVGGIPEIAATLSVACTKTGDVGIVSEEEHRY